VGRCRPPLLLAASLLALASCSSTSHDSLPSTIASLAPSSSSSLSPASSSPSTSPSSPGSSSSGTSSSLPVPSGRPRVRFTSIASFTEPVDLRIRPGDDASLLVAERGGRIRALRDGRTTTVLDMSSRTKAQGERGLLGFTFSPDGATLYVDYTDPNGDSHVDHYPMRADGTADTSQRQELLFQKQPYVNHNGGNLVFGPDGRLYIGFGDGGSSGDPQNRAPDLGTWLGKLLRVDPTRSGGLAPDDNPFVATAGARPEIWSFGLRNPWRFSFDAANGDLWIADVGQDAVEEVDKVTPADGLGKGVNFGWSHFEGTHVYRASRPAPNAVPPVFDYTHEATGGCSVTGGFVYRGAAVPALQGFYVFGDLCWTGIRAWSPATGIVDLGGGMTQVVSFGQGHGNELYVLSFGDNRVYRIDPA